MNVIDYLNNYKYDFDKYTETINKIINLHIYNRHELTSTLKIDPDIFSELILIELRANKGIYKPFFRLTYKKNYVVDIDNEFIKPIYTFYNDIEIEYWYIYEYKNILFLRSRNNYIHYSLYNSNFQYLDVPAGLSYNTLIHVLDKLVIPNRDKILSHMFISGF